MTTAVIMALSTGLPVIVTTHSGFPDQVIDGKNGYLSRENDYKDFAEKILQYLESPKKWPEMSRVARAHALATYDCDVLIKRQLAYYQKIVPGVKKVVFVVGVFPAISEAWLINQIADLIDRGIDIQIYSFYEGSEKNISNRYFEYKMKDRTIYLGMPKNKFIRTLKAIPKILRVFCSKPSALKTIFNINTYGAEAYSLKLLYQIEPFLSCNAQLIHCHFGTMANKFLRVRDALKLSQPFITTFYGYDVSSVVKEKGLVYYDRLKKECQYFFAMSENMKNRVAALGFVKEKIKVLPISEDVTSFPYKERIYKIGEKIRIVSIGRFVEKKGFDDAIKAIAIVKKRYKNPFIFSLIGGGELEEELRALTKEYNVEDVISFEGYMKAQDLTKFLMNAHLYLQPSKTAKNGDME